MNNLPFKLFSDERPACLIIGHRGASAYAPENTMSSFVMAYEMGAHMIELDVQLSADGVPVVIHDEILGRTTNGKGKVSEHTFSELDKLDAGSWYKPTFGGEPIPSLEQVLDFAQGKMAVNIEIKTEAVSSTSAKGIEEKSMKLVKQYGMEDYVLFSSFDYRALRHLRELESGAALAVLHEKRQAAGRRPSELLADFKAQAFNCNYRRLSEEWLKDTADNGIPVFVYTVNKRRAMKKMISSGVKGIFTDKPDVLKQLVEKLWEIN